MLPQAVRYVLERLEDAGFAAYAVGGCVRDTLLGRTPGDWDVTTAARPEQVLTLFDGYAIPTGLKHGTVTVRAGEMHIEVTTFRADGTYTDHRRPDQVFFSDRLEEDLCRRDLTVNAMAMERLNVALRRMGCVSCGRCALPPYWDFRSSRGPMRRCG